MPDAPKTLSPDEAGVRVAVDAAIALHGVPMAPEWRDAVVSNFATVTAAAHLVAEFPLSDETEVAPVFRA